MNQQIMKCPHSIVARGKRVLVRLHDGSKFVDRYKDNTRTAIILEKHHRVARADIKSMTIYREPNMKWRLPDRYSSWRIDNEMAKLNPGVCPIVDRDGRLCTNELDEAGCCAMHGKVRFGPHEKEEDQIGPKPIMRKTPPKKTAVGKIRPRFRKLNMFA